MNGFHHIRVTLKHLLSLLRLSTLTLDDESEAETAEGQVGKNWLFFWLAHDVTSCVVVAELESQGELSGLDLLFKLRSQQRRECLKKDLSQKKQTCCCCFSVESKSITCLGCSVVLTTSQRSTPSVCSTSTTL